MACNYRWLDKALDDMSQEIGYVFSQFGVKAAQRAEARIHDGVRQLCQFPNSGVRYEEMSYKGSPVRILHLRQISLIYAVEDELITIIAVWNNFQNPDHLRDVIAAR